MIYEQRRYNPNIEVREQGVMNHAPTGVSLGREQGVMNHAPKGVSLGRDVIHHALFAIRNIRVIP